MAQSQSAQVRTCATNNVVPLKAEQEPKRNRPQKLGIPTPAGETFEFWAAQIARIPKDRRSSEEALPAGVRGWNAAKDHARGVINRDRRLSGVAKALACVIIDHINRTHGYDWHGNKFFAEACACTKKTITDALQRLVLTGHVVRRRKKTEAGDWDNWETTLPTLARAAVIEPESEIAGTRQSTEGCPSIDGGVSVDHRGGGNRQSTDLTCPTLQPLIVSRSEPLSPPNLPSGDYPPEGDHRSAPSARSPREARPDESTVSEAFQLYNAVADQHGFVRVEYAAQQRRKRMAKRLSEIGGIEKFKVALDQVVNDDFLMGRVQSRDHSAPFRLSIDRLLSDRTNLGDVLARLIEKSLEPAYEPKTKAGQPDSPPPKPYWWRGNEQAAREAKEEGWEEFVRRWANGEWPEEILGPPPGTPDCLVPESIIRKLNLIERYGVKGTHG